VRAEFLEKWNIPSLFVEYWLNVTGDCEIKSAYYLRNNMH